MIILRKLSSTLLDAFVIDFGRACCECLFWNSFFYHRPTSTTVNPCYLLRVSKRYSNSSKYAQMPCGFAAASQTSHIAQAVQLTKPLRPLTAIWSSMASLPHLVSANGIFPLDPQFPKENTSTTTFDLETITNGTHSPSNSLALGCRRFASGHRGLAQLTSPSGRLILGQSDLWCRGGRTVGDADSRRVYPTKGEMTECDRCTSAPSSLLIAGVCVLPSGWTS